MLSEFPVIGEHFSQCVANGNGDVLVRIWKEQCGNEYNVKVKEFIVMLLNNVYCVIWGNGQLAKSVIPSNTLP